MLSPVIMMVVPILPSISQFVYSKLKTLRNFNENEVKSSRNTIEMKRNFTFGKERHPFGSRKFPRLEKTSYHEVLKPHKEG
jgi:hypothetical protein